MKVEIKRVLIIVLSVVMLAVCIPHKAEAKTLYRYNITKVKQNKWFSAKSVSYDYKSNNPLQTFNLYRIAVPANVYVTFERDKKDSSIWVFDETLKTRGQLDTSSFFDFYYGDDRPTKFSVVLPKGSYYLYVNLDTKLRWSAIKVSDYSNFCRVKARKLVSGKKETIVFADGYEYDRWYKVILKKKKPLTVNLKSLDVNRAKTFYVYDSKGNQIQCPELTTNTSYRTASIPKGTYYIRVKHEDNSSLWNSSYARIVQFSWK